MKLNTVINSEENSEKLSKKNLVWLITNLSKVTYFISYKN